MAMQNLLSVLVTKEENSAKTVSPIVRQKQHNGREIETFVYEEVP